MDQFSPVEVMKRYSVILWILLFVLICMRATSPDTVITLMPRNLTVREGEYATFRCELPCSHVAFWYVGDFHNSFPLPYDDTDTELVYTRGQIPEDGCSATDPGTYIDTITLLATADMNDVAVQCSASMIQCGIGDTCNSVYSRFRTLRVESSAVSPSPSPSPSVTHTDTSTSSSSTQTTACPSPNPVTVTSTVSSVSTTTMTLTKTQPVTQTTTNTLIVTATPEACPPDSNDAGGSLLLKGLGLTCGVAVATVVVILQLLLHL